MFPHFVPGPNGCGGRVPEILWGDVKGHAWPERSTHEVRYSSFETAAYQDG